MSIKASYFERIAQTLFTILQGHRGAHNAISAPEICTMLSWAPGREREVRAVIEEHANDSWEGTLCAIPGRGYFFAETIEEVKGYRNYLLGLRHCASVKLSRFDAAAARDGLSLKGVV